MANPTSPQRIPRLRSSRSALVSERWQAIAHRDATIDSFVYGVLTTKIYCRPSCSARLARRANVCFYDTPAQAEQAGFRPCKRCRPHSGQTAAQSNPQAAMVDRACTMIREHVAAGLKPRLQDLATQAGLTPSHFHRMFKKHMGLTPGQYASDVAHRDMAPSASRTPSTPELETLQQDLVVNGDRSDLLNLDQGEGQSRDLAGMLTPGSGDFPVIPDEPWNDFDVLLAADQDPPWLLDSLIDPKISAESGQGSNQVVFPI
ncbi:transcriptional regulator family: Helix-turn-helix [Penicillium alfredii]|uniref:Transcriptional regulator family: Helix-turn-helix n=1 Tax=Penicillium alfredii TaxID=1506179 RepID=A0A9W9FQF0_9EURO|nr:transcriptional regulator family: Helix-turn-helix [Penicillium alfredii]KAJ5104526.1 transcriptional regulator family: Helix-turn-helix [Penicillium alfredii]